MADLDLTTERQIEGLRDRAAAGDALIVGVNVDEGADVGDAHAPGGVIDGSANLGSDTPGTSDVPGGGGRGGGGGRTNQQHKCKLVAGFMGKKDVPKTYTEEVEIFRRNDLCEDPCAVPSEERTREIKQDLIWQPVIPLPKDPKTPPREPPYTPPDTPPTITPEPTPTPRGGEKPTPTGGGGSNKQKNPGGPHIDPNKKLGKKSTEDDDNPCEKKKSPRRNHEGNRENICKYWFPFRDGSGRAAPKEGISWHKTESLGDGQSVSSHMETDGRSIFQGPAATKGDGFLENLDAFISCIRTLFASKGLIFAEGALEDIITQCQAENNFKIDGEGGIKRIREIAEVTAKCLGENIDTFNLLNEDGEPISSFVNEVLKCLCRAFISNKENLAARPANLEGANQADVPETMELGRDIIPVTYVNSDGRTKDIIKSPGLSRSEISEALNGPDSFVFEEPEDLASFEDENQDSPQVEDGLPVVFNAVADKGCPCSEEELNHLLLTAQQAKSMIAATLQRCATAAYLKARELIKASEKAQRESHRQARRNEIRNKRTLRNARRKARRFNYGFRRLMRQGFGRTDGKAPSSATQVKEALVNTGLPQFASNTFPPFVEGGETYDGSQGESFPFKEDLELSDLPASQVLEENPQNLALDTIENHQFYDDMEDVIATDGVNNTPEIQVGTNGLNKAGVRSVIRDKSCIPRQFITKFLEGTECRLDKNLGKLLFGACSENIAGLWNVDDISGLSDTAKSRLKDGVFQLPLKDWNTIFATHKGRKNNGLDSARNSEGTHKDSIFKSFSGRDGLGANEGFGGPLRDANGELICSQSRDLRGSTYKLRSYFRKLKREIEKVLGKYMRQLDEQCLKKQIDEDDRRRQAGRLGAGNPVNNNGNPDRKNRKQGKKTKKPVPRRVPKNNRGKRRQRWLNLARGLQAIRRRSPSAAGNIDIYKNLGFFQARNFYLDDEAINDVDDKTDEQILDNFLNNLVPETLMPGTTFSTEEPETYSIETNLVTTDDFRIYSILTLGEDYGVSEIFNKTMDHYHSQMKLAVALWNETVADSFPEAVIGRGIGLFAESMSLQPYIHAYAAPSPVNFLVPDGMPLAPNQFGVTISMPALQDQANLSLTSSELAAFRALVRLISRWTKGFARSYESLMGSTARVFIEGIDPIPTGATSLPAQLDNPNNLSDDTAIVSDSQLLSDTSIVLVEYIAKFGDAYAGTVNSGLTGLDVENWGKVHSGMVGNLQNLTLDDLNLSTTDKINAAVFNDREVLDKGITLSDADYKIDNWLVNEPPYSDDNPPQFSFTIRLNFGGSVPYDSNYTPGTDGPTMGQALQQYIKELFGPYLNDIQDNAKQTKVGAHIIWPTNYPLPTEEELKGLVNTNGTPTNADDFSTVVLPGSTNILMIPKSRPLTVNDADPLVPTIDLYTGAQPVIQHTTNQYGALIAPSGETAAPSGAIPVAIGSVFPEGITMSKMMDVIDLNFNVLYGWLGHTWQEGAPGSMNYVTITGVDDPTPGKLTVMETDHTGVPLECKRPRITTPLLPGDCYLAGDVGFAIPLKDKNNTVGFMPLKTFQINPRNIATGFTADEAARPPILGLNQKTFVNDGSGLVGSPTDLMETVINTINKLVFNKRCAETQLITMEITSADEVVERDWPIEFDSVPFVPLAPFEASVSGTSTLYTLKPSCLSTTGGKFGVLGDTTVFDSPVTVTVPVTGMTIPQSYKDNITMDQGVQTEGVCGVTVNQSGLTTDRTTQLTLGDSSIPEESRNY